MASYKQNCIFCDALIESDSRFCPGCGSRSPFALRCPSCMKEVSEKDTICPGCGRPLMITCPFCGEKTFVVEKCGSCGRSLMIPCPNNRCGEMVFFQNTHCRACGKRIRK